MSLRNQPLSERVFATLVLLGLGAFLAGGLAFGLRRDRRGPAPAARPRLLAVLDGAMAPNVSPAEVQAFEAWVQGGATQEGFRSVAPIVAGNCARCHGPGGQFPRLAGFEDLRPLAVDGGSDGFYAMIGDGALHLALFPLVFLVAGFGYLRRTAWAHRRMLGGACLGAVLFDVIRWWLHQGRPEAPWTAWTASALLAATLATLVALVLRELWWGAKAD
ncbi:MAG: hypothetical protein P4L11_13100 [Geothrix sp.]|nr:hypothetical protein [Geothrix sp.]